MKEQTCLRHCHLRKDFGFPREEARHDLGSKSSFKQGDANRLLACYSNKPRGRRPGGTDTARPSSSVWKQNTRSKSSKDVIVVKDDVIPAARGQNMLEKAVMIVRRDHNWGIPEPFSDPDECGDGKAESGGSRECAEGGRSSTSAKEEDAPGNQDVIRTKKKLEKDGCLYPACKASEVCHIYRQQWWIRSTISERKISH